MAKLAVVAALLAGLLFVSLAAATTTLTTVEVNEGEDNPYRGYGGGSERCREQLEEADELRHCEDVLREQVREGRFGQRRFGGVDPYERYGREGRYRGEEGRGSRRLRNCCQQLRQMDERCRCEGLREIAREQRQRGYGEEREDLERIAEKLPQMCGVSPGRCDVRRGGRRM